MASLTPNHCDTSSTLNILQKVPKLSLLISARKDCCLQELTVLYVTGGIEGVRHAIGSLHSFMSISLSWEHTPCYLKALTLQFL
jgi:hypothetical protein